MFRWKVEKRGMGGRSAVKSILQLRLCYSLVTVHFSLGLWLYWEVF